MNPANSSAEPEGLLKSKVRMRSLLPPATGSEVRDVVGVVGVRIVAITVVSGRRRRMDVIARPIPGEGWWLALCRQKGEEEGKFTPLFSLKARK